MTIAPQVIDERVHPGGYARLAFYVSNTGGEPLTCTASAHALAVDGGLPVAVAEAERSCRDWLALEPAEFELKPQEGRSVAITVRPPPGTSGGYYALLSCLGVPPQPAAAPDGAGTSARIRFSHRVNAVLMLTVAAGRLEACIEAAAPTFRAHEDGGFELSLPVRNTGNIHTRIAGAVELRSETGVSVEQFAIGAGRGFLLPSHERNFTSRSLVRLPDGIYIARIELRPVAGGEAMRNAFPFYVRGGEAAVAPVTDELRQELLRESAGFIVTPAQIQFAMRAGARRAESIELTNLTDRTLTVRAVAASWARSPAGVDRVVAADQVQRSLGDGLELRFESIELRPRAKRRVPLLIGLDAAATGERYGAVTFERDDVMLDASPEGLARRSSLITVYAERTGEPACRLAGFTVERKPNGAYLFHIALHNTGNVSIEPELEIRLLDDADALLGRLMPARPPFAIQAEGSADGCLEWSQVMEPGQYTAELLVRYVHDRPPLADRLVLTVPPPQAARGDGETEGR